VWRRVAAVNFADVRPFSFRCLTGCGFCCVSSVPAVDASEAPGLGDFAVAHADGTLSLRMVDGGCAALGDDLACTAYDVRPTSCHLYPFHIHAGRRVQVTATLACPGVQPTVGDTAADGLDAPPAESAAAAAAAHALARDGAQLAVDAARATFATFDERMDEWGVRATPDRLRKAFLPHATRLANLHALPAFFEAIAPGELMLSDKRPQEAIGALFETATTLEPRLLLADMAQTRATHARAADAVDDALTWWHIEVGNEELTTTLRGHVEAVTTAWSDLPTHAELTAQEHLASYLERLMHRDHVEGTAAWIVDQSGYQATPAAAYARVLAEASVHAWLMAGSHAARDGRSLVTQPDMAFGLRAADGHVATWPTIGAIL